MLARVAVLLLGCLLLPAATAAAPRWDYHGVVFGGGEWSSADAGLGTVAGESALRAAVASGASAIRLIPTWYTDSPNSTAIYRATAAREGPLATESDEAVGRTIALARQLGASVLLGPLVDPNWALPWDRRGSPGYPGAECLLWRSGKRPNLPQPPNCTASADDPQHAGRGPIGRYFSEEEWDTWFDSYSEMLLVYARLAQQHGASVLVVAAELWAAMEHPPNAPRWRTLVAKARAVFKGEIAVAANAQTLIPWHDAVDLLGFDMYNGLRLGPVPTAGPEPPPVAALAAAWQPYIAWLRNVSASTGKPILATELGFQSRPRSFVSPAGAARFNPGDCSVYLKCYSMEDQRLAYEAFYTAFAAEGDWFAGITWWLWRADPTSGGSNDLTFTPHGKPAAEEMKAFARSQGSLLALPPAPQLEGESEPETRAESALALDPSAAGGPWPSKQNGIVVGSGEWTSFEDSANSSRLDSAAAAASLSSAKSVGVNAVEFIPTWFFPARWKQENSTHMYRGQDTAAPHALATDTDDELRAGIAVAKRLGMRTSLSPMFDPDYSQLPWWNASGGGPTEESSLAGGGVGRGRWGAGWSAAQIGSWFEEYGAVIVGYAKLAEEQHVDAFHVGHELHTLLTNPDNEGQWRGLIERVRSVYKGKVSVAFNGNPFFNDVSRGGVPWLDALDFIGLDCYWPVYTDLTKLEHWWDVASVEDIVAGWQPTVAKMANVSKLSGKTITCTEVGYQSRNYAWIRGLNDQELDPQDCSSTANCVNLLAQARAYEGLIRALYPMDWFDGVYLWLWRTDPTAGGSSDDSYTPQQKPATAVMKALFT